MTYIHKLDGEIIDLDKAGIRTKDFLVSSPTPEHSTEKIVGGQGEVDMGSSSGPRDIICLFRMTAFDSLDFGMFRDEIFNLFKSEEAFYIAEKRNPGKRWLVKVKDPYNIEQRLVYGDFEITFICFKGMAESVGYTTDPQTFDAELWQIGQGLLGEDNEYVHDSATFEIYNAGDKTVDPRDPNMEISIEVKAAVSSYIEIINKTTGDTYRFDGKLTTSDTLKLEGIRSTKNGLSVFRDTNKKLIKIAPGFNEFEIKGTSSIDSITFDFRFYYN